MINVNELECINSKCILCRAYVLGSFSSFTRSKNQKKNEKNKKIHRTQVLREKELMYCRLHIIIIIIIATIIMSIVCIYNDLSFIQTNIFPFVIQLHFISIRMVGCLMKKKKRFFEKKTSKEYKTTTAATITRKILNAKDVGRKLYIIKMPLSIKKHLKKQHRKNEKNVSRERTLHMELFCFTEFFFLNTKKVIHFLTLNRRLIFYASAAISNRYLTTLFLSQCASKQ